MNAEKLIIAGQVQGVGFRPFIYNLAQKLNLNGWVRNNLSTVEIHLEDDESTISKFKSILLASHPPLARITAISEHPAVFKGFSDFSIVESINAGGNIHLPPDQAPCADCINDIRTGGNRRFAYPFTNCTQCGPRYTIIKAMPYDRANTAMVNFTLCGQCREEYNDPANRRFHAEPNACPECGPSLSFIGDNITVRDNGRALKIAVDFLQDGKIIAVKGAGGFHLMADAANDKTVKLLRRRKNRPAKPFALMVGDIYEVKKLVYDVNSEIIASQVKPIVIARRKKPAAVSELVAPGLRDLGVMLPSMPLYYLLCAKFNRPLIATSGNIGGEPVLTDESEARKRLKSIVDGFLIHDRPILRPADDSVVRIINKRPVPIRLGRGLAPLEMVLDKKLDRTVIAVGGNQKNTVVLAWDNVAVISPHIGDLSSKRSLEVFARVIADLQNIYQQQAQIVICDKHPEYASSRWAQKSGLQLKTVQHHRAHASALAAEHGKSNDSGLIFSWDGTGLGDDHALWGGETFRGCPGTWYRAASMEKFKLTGGEHVAYQPWRSAAALHWQAGKEFTAHPKADMLFNAREKNINTVYSSSVGRIFDAAAFMLGAGDNISFEGEAAMRLEAMATPAASQRFLPFASGRISWRPLLAMLADESMSAKRRAGLFHAILANTIVKISEIYRDNIDYIGLTGGVFQNRLLTALVEEKSAFACLTAERIPPNDGGLSFGQLIEWQYSDLQ